MGPWAGTSEFALGLNLARSGSWSGRSRLALGDASSKVIVGRAGEEGMVDWSSSGCLADDDNGDRAGGE